MNDRAGRVSGADLGVAMLVAAAWSLVVGKVFWGAWAADLSSLYLAGHFFHLGAYDQIYAEAGSFAVDGVPTQWAPALAAMGVSDPALFPFVYPPWCAAIVSPLAGRVGPTTFFQVFLVVHLAALVGSVVLCHRIVRPTMSLAKWMGMSLAMMLVSIVSISALVDNQPQILVTFFVLWAFERHHAGRSAQAGVLLAVAAAIKLSPAFLVVLFLVDRDKRAVGAFLGTGAAWAVMSLVLGGPQLHLLFAERVAEISSYTVLKSVNLNLELLLVEGRAWLAGERIVPVDPAGGIYVNIAEPAWVTWTVRTLLVSGTALVLWLGRRAPRRDHGARLVALLVWSTLCAPLSWNHHYLPVLLLLPSALVVFRLRVGVAVMAAFLGLTFWGTFVAVSQTPSAYHLPGVLGACTMLGLFVAYLVGLATMTGSTEQAAS